MKRKARSTRKAVEAQPAQDRLRAIFEQIQSHLGGGWRQLEFPWQVS